MNKQGRGAVVRDWALFGVGIAAVYATLPVARRIQTRATHAAGEQFVASLPGLILLACAVLGLGWLWYGRRERRPLTYFILVNVAAGYTLALSALATLPIERVHLLEYGALALLAWRATRHHFAAWTAYGVAMLLVFDVGFADELIQHFLPDRVYDPRDVVTNAIAGLLGLAAVLAAQRPVPAAKSRGERLTER